MDPTQAAQIVIDLKLALALAGGCIAVMLAVTITVSSWISVRSARSAAREGGASAADRSQAAVGGGPILQQQIGSQQAQAAICQREAEHSVILRELAEVQRRQVGIDEQIVGLVRRMDERLANIEEQVLELVVVERQRLRGDARANGG